MWPHAIVPTLIRINPEKVYPATRVEATVARVQSRGRPIAETLQEHAQEIGAGLLVMGGFGHSRMRDFVLGGATGGILKDLRLPVLLSH